MSNFRNAIWGSNLATVDQDTEAAEAMLLALPRLPVLRENTIAKDTTDGFDLLCISFAEEYDAKDIKSIRRAFTCILSDILRDSGVALDEYGEGTIKRVERLFLGLDEGQRRIFFEDWEGLLRLMDRHSEDSKDNEDTDVVAAFDSLEMEELEDIEEDKGAEDPEDPLFGSDDDALDESESEYEDGLKKNSDRGRTSNGKPNGRTAGDPKAENPFDRKGRPAAYPGIVKPGMEFCSMHSDYTPMIRFEHYVDEDLDTPLPVTCTDCRDLHYIREGKPLRPRYGSKAGVAFLRDNPKYFDPTRRKYHTTPANSPDYEVPVEEVGPDPEKAKSIKTRDKPSGLSFIDNSNILPPSERKRKSFYRSVNDEESEPDDPPKSMRPSRRVRQM